MYTDYDKLQFKLKRCFRYNKNDNKYTYKLTKRLSDFYHWRVGLIIVLNKFGCRVFDKDNNIDLLHGVNCKMLINFHPTLSFYVAKTFATSKGMVLKVKSAYKRLNYCKAFDASLLNDFVMFKLHK